MQGYRRQHSHKKGGKAAGSSTPRSIPIVLSQHSARRHLKAATPALISLALVAVTFLLYCKSFRYGYVLFDDSSYVYENPMVQSGISLKGIAWAFTTFEFTNWHPLTWISYMLDVQLFGLNPGAQHAINVLLHAGATLLLFQAFLRMTREVWCACTLAAVFALHPLHVESVAWIAERKDVLSTFFLMLTLLLYVRYVERPRPTRYLCMFTAFALSLLAKPMAVTFPFVLLLLDIWPLRRIAPASLRIDLRLRVLEKVPLLAISALASMLTFLAQRRGGAVPSLALLPIADRLGNALSAYLKYIGKAVWPVDMALLYPLQPPSATTVLLALVTLTAVTIMAVKAFRTRPYFLVGWLWYLGMLVPVIGLVQVGRQSMADRYMYLPLVGLSIPPIWMANEFLEKRPFVIPAGRCAAILVLAVFAALTYRQLDYWKNSKTLFEHAIAVTTNNAVMETNLGIVLQRQGKFDEAAKLYREALAADPNHVLALSYLGAIVAEQGKHDEAIALYRKAIAMDPNYAEALAHLGHEFSIAGRDADAFRELKEALRGSSLVRLYAHVDLGILLANRGDYAAAKQSLEAALGLDNRRTEIWSDLCGVLNHLGELDQASKACGEALRLRPDSPDAGVNLAGTLAARGQTAAAAEELSRVLAANPN
jgi:protein O-mannosyl-transferase